MTEIVIWRHAEAEVKSESGLDSERALTRKGREDGHNMAKWLNKHLPADTKIYCSPALRCKQTVEALTKLSKKKRQWNVQYTEVLSLESHAHAIRQQLILSNSTAVLLVGHQPILGELVGDLLHKSHTQAKSSEPSLLSIDHISPTLLFTKNNDDSNMQFAIKKGAVWWLRHRNQPQVAVPKGLGLSEEMYVLTVQHPKFLPIT